VNSGLVLLHWHIGCRIRRDVLKEKRAEYGQKILQSLAAKLIHEFGPGYSARNLWHMGRFAEMFPGVEIVNALSTQLGRTYFRHLLPLDDPITPGSVAWRSTESR